MIITTRAIKRRYNASFGRFWETASVEASPLTRRSLRECFEAISGKPFATTDFGFDGLDDWSLGQRVNLQRLKREAPRFFKPQTTATLLSVLQSKYNDVIRHQLAQKSFLVPIKETA